MRPKRQSRKNIENSDQNSINQVIENEKRSFSSEHLYKQIKGLHKSINFLINKANLNQNKIQSIQKLIQSESIGKTRPSQGNTSQFSSEDYYQRGPINQNKAHQARTKRFTGLQLARTNSQRQLSLNPDNKVLNRQRQIFQKRKLPQLNLNKKYSINTINSIKFADDSAENQIPILQRKKSDRKKQIAANSLMKLKYKKNFESFQQKLDWIRQNAIGINTTYISPLQLELEAVYVDHTATNRPFKQIQIMIDYAKLFSANPHTEYSYFGKFSTNMMHYALQSHLNSFNANPNQYIVIPTGAGSTGAIKHAIQIIKNTQIGRQKDLTVFITPYQHHSNILPWVQFFPKLQVLVNDQNSGLIINLIYEQLSKYPSSHMIITISAASNVTSMLTDLKSMNSIIRDLRQKYNKKIIFGVDCAAYCCHKQLNLKQFDQIDLAYISPHKNLGGAQTCGLLLLRKSISTNSKPSFPGGGTVALVSGYQKKDIVYDSDIFARQIQGTPSFFAYYRSALSFQLLNDAIGYDFIHQSQRKNTQLFFKLIHENNIKLHNQGIQSLIKIYGDQNLNKRANVIPFNIILNNRSLGNHHLISIFLTDIFGIQVRSGCFCAGPYGRQLLKLNQRNFDVQKVKQQVIQGNSTNKPGFVRVDMTFYLKQYEVKYIAKSIFYIAKFYKNLQKLYNIDQNGKISLKNKISKHKNYQYQLRLVNEAYQQTQQHYDSNDKKLKNRKNTLEKQLKIGKSICQHPEDFMR